MTQNSINSKQPFVQYVKTQTTSTVTLAATIPKDNTIPQKTEGTEVMTCSITPTSATNLLVIRVTLNFYTPSDTDVQFALFQDDTSNALAAFECQYLYAANWAGAQEFLFEMVAGTTSSTTFKVRCGRSSATNTLVNRAQFGGVQTNYMEIKEIKA